MKKSVKVSAVISAYKVLGDAKYQKLEDSDKVKLWKISRQLKPVATQFEEDKKDATEKLIPEGFAENYVKAREYEQKKKEGVESLPMTEEQFLAFVKELNSFNKLLDDALKELIEKEIELDYEPLSEEAFGNLMASNDWTLGQMDAIEWIIE